MSYAGRCPTCECPYERDVISCSECGEMLSTIPIMEASRQPDPLLAEVISALDGLEKANDLLASTRSQETYLSMIDADNAQIALDVLDGARARARALLSRIDKQQMNKDGERG